jgi:shikimate kinase
MILKLKRTPGIYLVGFMACGKSTVGRMLADALGWHFADLDHDIESEQHMKISDIFDTLGEEAFRDMESQALENRVRSIERGRPTVVALGGGTFLRESNYRLLCDHGITIWIDCALDIIRERVAECTHRPLARDADKMQRLYAERRDLYSRAEYRIETRGDSSHVVQAILELPIFS